MICVFLADGFEEFEAIAPLDILKRSKIKIKTVGVEKEIVTGSLGISIKADTTIQKIDKEEIEGIILPGGMPGTTNLSKNKNVRDIINYCMGKNILIAAICAAPSILGEMGILSGKEACCYPGFEKNLINAKISTNLVCVSENIITAKGPGAATEFGFKILEYIKGKRTVKIVKNSMQFVNE